jgi:hypothetical protein
LAYSDASMYFMLIREQWAPILFQPHENYITDDLGKYYMCITSVVTAVISYTMMNSSWYQDSNIGSTTSPHSRICTSPNPQPPCFPHGGSGDFAQEKFQFTRPEKLHTRSEVDLSTHTHTHDSITKKITEAWKHQTCSVGT